MRMDRASTTICKSKNVPNRICNTKRFWIYKREVPKKSSKKAGSTPEIKGEKIQSVVVARSIRLHHTRVLMEHVRRPSCDAGEYWAPPDVCSGDVGRGGASGGRKEQRQFARPRGAG
jgi:hypothetical protein